MTVGSGSSGKLLESDAHVQPRGIGQEAGPTRSNSRTGRSGLRSVFFFVLCWCLAVAPPTLLLIQGIVYRWVCDDAYIDFRVVGNILEGFGPVFNRDERVEAFTSPLWTGLLALWGATGLSIPW